MSDSERPEKSAFSELQKLVGHLGDELASFRRRAIQAETKLKTIESAETGVEVTPARFRALERENADLKRRVDGANTRTRQMLDRVRFLRQQHQEVGR